MGQRPKDLTPHQSLQHYWGAELRALRVARGLSLAELGHQLHCDPSYLAKIERTERAVPVTLAESCDRVLETQGALVRLRALAETDRDMTANPCGQAPIHVVTDDVHVANPTGNLAGGTTFPAAPDTDEEIVVPARTSDGRVVFVSVPRRVFLHGLGSAAVGLTAAPVAVPTAADVHPVEHFQQMRRVLRDNDNLFGAWRVIPVVREQMGIMQQLRLSWRGADHRALVRVEAQYSEFCGWLHQDTGEHQLAESWTDRALSLSHLAEDRDLTAFTLARRAGLAVDMQIAADAIGFADQALRIAPPRSRIAALATTRAAHGHALSGDYPATERAYEHARELIGTLDHDPASPCGSWLDENYIALQRARSLAVLGDYHRAAQSFQDAFADRLRQSRRARGVYLSRAALAQAGDRQVEHAATLGLDALAIGFETGSARILTELARLDDALAAWNTVPAVADFRTAMKDTISRQA